MALQLHLQKEGANLVLTSIVQEELNNAKQTLEEEYGVKVLALYADGGDYSQSTGRS